MWKTVLNLEWRILRRDRAAMAVLVMFSLFLLVAALAGGHHASKLSSGLALSQSLESKRNKSLRSRLQAVESSSKPLTNHDPRDPVWMGKEGATRLVILPPAPLAPIAVGQRDLYPQAVRVNSDVHLTSERETETAMSGPTRLMSGAFDPAFLFVVLFPLVIIALSYELLSGERERGTLAMLLSQPVSQRALVLGKAMARAIALCGVTVVFALVGLLIAGAELNTAAAWLHVSLYVVVLIAWASFWFAAAITVNGLRQSSASNALILVGLWLVLVVVVPGLVHAVVDAVHPPPSRMERVHDAREVAQDVERKLAGLQGRHDRNTKTTGYARDVVETQRELAKRSAPVLDELREQLLVRQHMLDTLRFLSPAIVVQLALEDIAGAGVLRHHNFETQVDTFHKEFRTFFFDRIDQGVHLKTTDLEALPSMTFREEPHSALLARVTSGILGLFIAIFALLAIAWRGLRKIDRLAG